jgi:uncharacterized protein YqgC (DUF456 family)
VLTWLLIVVLVIGLLVIPLGLPGIWIMIGVVAVGAIMREVGTPIVMTTLLIAVLAELIEFFIVKRLTQQYGGSRKAFWGAIIGGTAGLLVGIPIPIVGSIIAGLLGTFVGAALVTYAETKQMISAHRVGWGAVIGRALSAISKTAAGIVILVLATAALLR